MSQQLLLLEFNEINFDYVTAYCARGLLPNLGRLIGENGIAETTSEQRYEELEPWIQWVTAHTGKKLADHGVFRLGDIVKHDLSQIWEELEEQGLRIGAISPMNAKNRLRDAAFFVPDPWTATKPTATRRLTSLHEGIAQAVNENAQARVTPTTLWHVLKGFGTYASASNYREYARLVASSWKRPWRRAVVLDLLLADVFVSEVKRTAPDFASLFLNSGAHIQHHYLFSSACYSGPHKNPDWYIPRNADPVREVYEIYDRILGRVRHTFPGARIMIATGLHQDPHDGVTYYWRLCEHERFLSRIRVPFRRVEPRMSRDFLVICASAEQAAEAEQRLSSAVAADGTALFDVDNRGSDLFVTLIYARDIGPGFALSIDGKRYADFQKDVAFVALKNGEHNGVGYFLDTAACGDTLSRQEFPLSELPTRIMGAFGFSGKPGQYQPAMARSA
jgi:hypothetical protein